MSSKKEPKLRFPEFRDKGEWEFKAIGKMGEVITGSTPSTAETFNYGGNWPFVSPADISDERYISKTKTTLTDQGFRKTRQIKANSILFVCIGSTIGKVAQTKVDCSTNQQINSIVPFDEYSSEFIYSALVNKSKNIAAIAGKQAVPIINKTLFSSVQICQPKLPEQKKIGDFFLSIDELITTQTQKIDALKSHKKGLMQRLFPAEGETVPKLRFPEFRDEGAWKKKQIGEVLIEQSRPIEMKDEQDYSLVTVKRRYGGVVSRGIFKGESIKVKSQFSLKANDFLISKRQIVHCACGLVPEDLEGSIVSNEYAVLRARKDHDILFFNYFSQQFKISQSFLECAVGIHIEKMLFKLDAWLKHHFLFPPHAEQKKIAHFLSSIDELITAQTQKLDDLKAHKKGLMQQLFPSIDNEVHG